MSILTLYIGDNSQILDLAYVRDYNNQDLIDATLQFTIKDSDGTIIENGTLDYVVGSASNYQALIIGQNFIENETYAVRVWGSRGGLLIDFENDIPAEQRKT